MAKLYILQKGQKSVKYANGRSPWMRYQKYRIVCVLLSIITIAQSYYIYTNMFNK